MARVRFSAASNAIGSTGWVQSRAWISVFSSIESTTADPCSM